MDNLEEIIRRPKVVPLICILILTIRTIGWSNGETVKIIIDGDSISSPIEFTSPEIVRQFNIWNGPGVSTRGPDGVTHPPAYMNPDNTSGRFIDWPRGKATDPPAAMQRLEVTFFIGGPRGPVHNGKFLFA